MTNNIDGVILAILHAMEDEAHKDDTGLDVKDNQTIAKLYSS